MLAVVSDTAARLPTSRLVKLSPVGQRHLIFTMSWWQAKNELFYRAVESGAENH